MHHREILRIREEKVKQDRRRFMGQREYETITPRELTYVNNTVTVSTLKRLVCSSIYNVVGTRSFPLIQ